MISRMKAIIKRAVVSLSLPDNKTYPTAQIAYSGKTSAMEVIYPYGLAGNLPEGLQVLVFSVEGHEENKAGVGYSQGDRFKNLAPGEVVVGNPQTGAKVYFKTDGSVQIFAPGNITIDAPNVIINGINFNQHVHPITGGSSAPGPTGVPQ